MKTEYSIKLVSMDNFLNSHAILTHVEKCIKRAKKSEITDKLVIGLLKLRGKTNRLRIRERNLK